MSASAQRKVGTETTAFRPSPPATLAMEAQRKSYVFISLEWRLSGRARRWHDAGHGYDCPGRPRAGSRLLVFGAEHPDGRVRSGRSPWASRGLRRRLSSRSSPSLLDRRSRRTGLPLTHHPIHARLVVTRHEACALDARAAGTVRRPFRICVGARSSRANESPSGHSPGSTAIDASRAISRATRELSPPSRGSP